MTNESKPIRSYDQFTTNIVNLPEGDYMTHTGHSDTTAWLVVGRTYSTMTLQEVLVERDPSFTPEFIPGGFSGYCTNQGDQTWLYAGLSPRTTKVRLRKSRFYGSDKLWASKDVGEFVDNGARHFRDYNF